MCYENHKGSSGTCLCHALQNSMTQSNTSLPQILHQFTEQHKSTYIYICSQKNSPLWGCDPTKAAEHKYNGACGTLHRQCTDMILQPSTQSLLSGHLYKFAALFSSKGIMRKPPIASAGFHSPCKSIYHKVEAKASVWSISTSSIKLHHLIKNSHFGIFLADVPKNA